MRGRASASWSTSASTRRTAVHSICAGTPHGGLADVEAWLVGVRCDLDEVVRRREATPEGYAPARDADGQVAAPIVAWQADVHRGLTYDVEVDTTDTDPEACAEAITCHMAAARPRALPELTR